MAGRPWIKLHTRWLTSPAHADLSGEVLATGVILMLLVADQGEDDGEGGRWLPHRPDHRATTAQDVVGIWLRRGRVRVDTGRRHVQALVKAGSFAIDAQGRLGMPKWAKWQEHPSAKRVRKHRSGSVTVTREVEEEVEEEGECRSVTRTVTPKANLHERAAQIPTRGQTMAAELAKLSQWRQYGGDPDGLGPWPRPTAPDGTVLPPLTLPARGTEILTAGRSALDVHRTAHTLARMVEAGALPKADHRGSYVFTGHYEDFEQKALEWSNRQERSAHADECVGAEELTEEDRKLMGL